MPALLRMLMLLLMLSFSALAPRSALAGPWTKGRGEVYVKLWEGAFLSSSFVDATGAIQRGIDHVSWTTALYAEVGLLEGLHFQIFAPYVIGRNKLPGARFLSLGGGDLLVGLQWTPPIPALAFARALRVEAKVPLYSAQGPTGPEATRFPRRGDGQVDVTLALSVGHVVEPLGLTLQGELGHRFRTELFVGDPGFERSYLDTLVASARVGYRILERGALGVGLEAALPYGRDAWTKSHLHAGASLYAPVWAGLAVELDAGAIVLARNASNGLTLGLGISYNLSR